MKAENIEKLVRKFCAATSSSVRTTDRMDSRVLADALAAYEKPKHTKPAQTEPLVWRIIIMKSTITKIAVAAVIAVAIFIGYKAFTPIEASAAQQVLQDAVKAVSDLWSVHMKTRMRTLPADNFSLIGLNYDFVPIEMWKRTGENGLLQWRVEKPGRVIVMDGRTTVMLIRPNHGVLMEKPLPLGCFDSWSGRLLNVNELLDSELQNAKNNPDRQVCLSHENIEGQDKIILEVKVAADVPEGDYLRNKFIIASDHLKVYRFDAKTKLLEGLQVYVHTGDKDVLIFEITDIEYNTEIAPSLFALELPEDVIWMGLPQPSKDDSKYQPMTPKEVARAFWQACTDENWDEFLKFHPQSAVPEEWKAYFGGLQIISIGEPFKSGLYPGWFVPYEIKFKDGQVKKMNLAVRNDNPAKRYVVDGGF